MSFSHKIHLKHDLAGHLIVHQKMIRTFGQLKASILPGKYCLYYRQINSNGPLHLVSHNMRMKIVEVDPAYQMSTVAPKEGSYLYEPMVFDACDAADSSKKSEYEIILIK